jgi:hypothetical protein
MYGGGVDGRAVLVVSGFPIGSSSGRLPVIEIEDFASWSVSPSRRRPDGLTMHRPSARPVLREAEQDLAEAAAWCESKMVTPRVSLPVKTRACVDTESPSWPKAQPIRRKMRQAATNDHADYTRVPCSSGTSGICRCLLLSLERRHDGGHGGNEPRRQRRVEHGERKRRYNGGR